MADEVEIAKNSLDVLSQASELASKFSAVSNILRITAKLSSAFPFLGSVLGFIQGFLPTSDHQEILRRFDELSNKIDKVREDIKDLEEMIKWELTELQYGTAVIQIKEGMRLCSEIGKGISKMDNQERLKKVCECPYITLSLNALIVGMTGNGLFQKSILDELYNKTKGNRPKVSALASRLLQLVCGGMIVLATYETVTRGKKGAEEVAKWYDSHLKEVCAKVESVIDRCVKNFEGNMLNDLNSKLDVGGSNQGLVTEISNLMRDKYDWLENFCLVYNDLQGFDRHCFNGYRVSSLHRNGKCGIVFYRKKVEPPKFSHRYDEAHNIVDDVHRHLSGVLRRFGSLWLSVPVDAQEGYKRMVVKLQERGIGLIGCAAIRDGSDLFFGGTFSTKTVSVVSEKAAAILLLS